MGFADKYLIDEEDLILDLKPHWWVFSAPATTSIFLFLLTIVLRDISILPKVMGVGLVAALLWMGWIYLEWSTTHFVITSKRLIYRHGVLTKNGIEIPLDRVSNVLFHQTLFERMLGAGDLVIESAGESGQQAFADVRKPNAVQNEIYYQIEQLRQRNSHSVVSKEESIPDQIQKLAELRDSGAITNREYETSKAELLKRL